MKKQPLIICTFFVLAVAIGGTVLINHFHHHNTSYEQGVLVVNGKRIAQADVLIDKTHAIVPLTAVLKALDFPVEETNSIIRVSINNKVFALDVQEATFSEEGDSTNLLLPPPGIRSYYCCAEKGDVFLDTVTLKGALYLSGFNIAVDVDRERGEVKVKGVGSRYDMEQGTERNH